MTLPTNEFKIFICHFSHYVLVHRGKRILTTINCYWWRIKFIHLTSSNGIEQMLNLHPLHSQRINLTNNYVLNTK